MKPVGTIWGRRAIRRGAAAGLLACALVAMPLGAQTSGEFRLPGATTAPANPRAAGPVDSENPVVRTGSTPSPSPSPSPSASAPPSPAASATSTAPRPTPAARPVPAAQRRAVPPTVAAPAPQSSSPPSDAVPGPVLPAAANSSPTETAIPTTPPPSLVENSGGSALPDWWPLAAGGLALALGLVGTGLWLRRRKASALEPEFEPPLVQDSPAEAEPAPRPVPVAEPASPPPPAPTPAPAPAPPPPVPGDDSLVLTFEARRMVASLMATTLSYRLVVTNRSNEPLSALAIEGDMVSAHSSLPPEQQMASGDNRLELRHAQVSLAPGESAEFTGDMRLPLSMVTPIRAGEAAYFVPLARFRIEASSPARGGFVAVQTFVIGELGQAAGAALRPFRLDLGPRTYPAIGQRAVG